MPDAGFHLDAVLARLTEVAYRLAAGLPLLLLAMLIVWLAWLFGSWLSRRAMFEHLVRSNAFLRDLARTTVRTVVVGLGVLAALELMDATAL
ncbi:MAG: hypothetical protein KDH18_03185, partial [Rhodoferax sp.]|nr:hypothetical protein [Rhodoferax sp.]